jgi:hypothetical protein
LIFCAATRDHRVNRLTEYLRARQSIMADLSGQANLDGTFLGREVGFDRMCRFFRGPEAATPSLFPNKLELARGRGDHHA